jgi:hypothetical protein
LELLSQPSTYSIGDTLYVCAFDGLNLREQPNVNSKVIGKLAFGEKVQVSNLPNIAFENEVKIGTSKGYWIIITQNDKTGYVFDAYLSELPNSKLNFEVLKFKKLDLKSEEDPYEGHQMEKELLNYIENNFLPICETVEYFDPNQGKGGQKLEISKYHKGFTKINKYGWEGYSLEFVTPNTRLSEIKNLILYIARKAVVYEKTYIIILDSLQKMEEYNEYQQILSLSMFGINIKKYPKSNTWAIEFIVAVA